MVDQGETTLADDKTDKPNMYRCQNTRLWDLPGAGESAAGTVLVRGQRWWVLPAAAHSFPMARYSKALRGFRSRGGMTRMSWRTIDDSASASWTLSLW